MKQVKYVLRSFQAYSGAVQTILGDYRKKDKMSLHRMSPKEPVLGGFDQCPDTITSDPCRLI
jgi:hypothetical protein